MTYIRKTTQNTKVTLKIVLALLVGMGLATAFWTLYIAFSGINQPLISPLTGIVSPAYASNTEIPKTQTRWWRLYQRVRWLESNNGTKGLALTCRSKGGYNEIGYLPVKGYCFKTLDDQEQTFASWITKHLTFEGMTEAQALRHYSNNAYGK